MNITVIHPCKGYYGGAEEVVKYFVEYLQSQECIVTLITLNAPEPIQKLAVNVIEARNMIDFLYESRLWSINSDETYAFNFPATLSLLDTSNTKWLCNELPEVFSTLIRRPIEAYHRRKIRKSKMKVVVADYYNYTRILDKYKVIPTIIPYGIDAEFWSQRPNVRTLRLPTMKGRKLVQIGIVSKFKNQHESVRLLHRLVKEGHDFSLIFVGKVPKSAYSDDLLVLIKELKLRNRVHFTGLRSQMEVRELLHYCCDILLHPVYGQGGWLTPLQAMCAKVPVVLHPDFCGRKEFEELGLVPPSQGLFKDILDSRPSKGYLDEIANIATKSFRWDIFCKQLKEL